MQLGCLAMMSSGPSHWLPTYSGQGLPDPTVYVFGLSPHPPQITLFLNHLALSPLIPKPDKKDTEWGKTHKNQENKR